MPCYTDPPSAMELATRLTNMLVREIQGLPPLGQNDTDQWSGDLQENTRKLCAWCKAHPRKVKAMSLELQIWWRDHQAEDRRHQREQAAERERARLALRALAKLTPAERKALNLREKP